MTTTRMLAPLILLSAVLIGVGPSKGQQPKGGAERPPAAVKKHFPDAELVRIARNTVQVILPLGGNSMASGSGCVVYLDKERYPGVLKSNELLVTTVAHVTKDSPKQAGWCKFGTIKEYPDGRFTIMRKDGVSCTMRVIKHWYNEKNGTDAALLAVTVTPEQFTALKLDPIPIWMGSWKFTRDTPLYAAGYPRGGDYRGTFALPLDAEGLSINIRVAWANEEKWNPRISGESGGPGFAMHPVHGLVQVIACAAVWRDVGSRAIGGNLDGEEGKPKEQFQGRAGVMPMTSQHMRILESVAKAVPGRNKMDPFMGPPKEKAKDKEAAPAESGSVPPKPKHRLIPPVTAPLPPPVDGGGTIDKAAPKAPTTVPKTPDPKGPPTTVTKNPDPTGPPTTVPKTPETAPPPAGSQKTLAEELKRFDLPANPSAADFARAEKEIDELLQRPDLQPTRDTLKRALHALRLRVLAAELEQKK